MRLVAVQALDGISAAVLGVMVPLVIADVTRGTGHFNLAQGVVGTGVGIGASISTTFAGYLSDHFGGSAAFLTLAGLAAMGFWLGVFAYAGDAAGAGWIVPTIQIAYGRAKTIEFESSRRPQRRHCHAHWAGQRVR